MTDTADNNYFAEGNATFGDRVEAARLSLRLSQEELAHKLGVKLKTVRGWEENLSEPRANKLQMMAGLMNVSIMWLLTGEGAGLTEPVEDVVIDEDMRDILIDLRKTRAEMTVMADRVGALEKRLGRIVNNG
jgi:transcriptional regulator with XRE-family HTH domain